LQITTSRHRDLKRDKRGLSNIIVVVLSLVILAIIVVNVILWNYQMSQSDWERSQEALTVNSVSRLTDSPWFVTQTEYQLNKGVRISGSFSDTELIDGNYERFRESSSPRELDINGTFSIDISSYPLAHIRSVELQLVYSVDDTNEQWYMRAYNWISGTFSNVGFNSTNGHSPSVGWNTYAINLTDQWLSYVGSDGRVIVKVHDQGPDASRTNIEIDRLAIRAVLNGAIFTFQNKGPRTAHLVSIWTCNYTAHTRYETDIFVNSGETMSYTRVDITLPNGQYTAKVITERGNIGVYADG
jgi:hypothetical protein